MKYKNKTEYYLILKINLNNKCIDTMMKRISQVKSIQRNIPINNYVQFKLLIENCLNSSNPRDKCLGTFQCKRYNIMLTIIDLVKPISSLSDKNRLTSVYKTISALYNNKLSIYSNIICIQNLMNKILLN